MAVGMMTYIALAIASLALGCGLVALFGDTWLLAMRAELWRRALDRAFGDGYRAGRADRR